MGQRPLPWLAYWRGRGFHDDAANHDAVGEYAVIVIAPLAGQAGS
jgi:hypothetical protein